MITDLHVYETQNLDLKYRDLLRKCLAVKLEITETALVEKDALSGEMLELLSTLGRQDRGLYEWCCLKVQLGKASAVNNNNYLLPTFVQGKYKGNQAWLQV